jgi:hypothetical protein
MASLRERMGLDSPQRAGPGGQHVRACQPGRSRFRWRGLPPALDRVARLPTGSPEPRVALSPGGAGRA